MNENVQAAVWGAFAADTLALGAHWIYNAQEIDRTFGRVDTPAAPRGRFFAGDKGLFHAGKKAGDFTHYGDQALILLRGLATDGRFVVDRFASNWQRLFHTTETYRDKATRTVLSRLEQGADPASAGSDSTDLGGAARMAPLVFWYGDDPQALIEAATRQTAMTHNTPAVLTAAALLAECVVLALRGIPPKTALETLREKRFSQPPASDWIDQGLAGIDTDTRGAIGGFGQMCEVDAAMPGVIHLVGRYETDTATALVENVMAGGDSAARGMAAGMILAAYNGLDAVLQKWIPKINAADEIREHLRIT